MQSDPRIVKVEAEYYQQFDADLSRDVPAEGYAGWKKATIELPLAHTAVVVMHAWDCGTAAQYPGWWRSIEYFPRADRIANEVFPPLLSAVRAANVKLYHVVGPGTYFQELPGYVATKKLAGPEPAPLPQVVTDPATAALREFRAEHIAFGKRNQVDIDAGYKRMDFPAPARPMGDEPIAENAHQLAAVCRRDGISHLIYIGFAINWCLLMSPGGMIDMRRHGLLCSTIKEATTAVENKESARGEVAKQLALWRTSIAFGFVFSAEPFKRAINPKA
jgi:hypothetical protein